MKRNLLFAAFLSSCVVAPVAAQDPTECGTREAIISYLEKDFGERASMVGIVDNGLLMELWANPETSTWTTTLWNGRDQMCIVLFGQSFATVTPIRLQPNL